VFHDHHTKRATEGRNAWSKIHSIEHGTPESFEAWKKYMPAGCECRKKVDAILQRMPPRYDSPTDWFEWTVDFHNEVNLSLDKPTVSMDRAYMIWKHRRPASGRKRAVITVANGVEFSKVLAVSRPYMQAYADRVDADLIDLDNDTESWAPMEKFRVYHFAEQYDEVLFVDADCIITEKCPDLFDIPGDVVIHDDYEVLKTPSIMDEERKRVSALSRFEIPMSQTAMNTGVVLTRKPASHIWKRPEVSIGTTRFAEQVWIEGQISADCLSVTRLPHEANWQFWYGRHSQPIDVFESRIRDAWIAHAAASTQKASTMRKIADHLSVVVPQPPIEGLTAVTSLSLLPHHIGVQERCLRTWLDMGLRIVAGNSEQDIEKLRGIYPYVEFRPCGQSASYDRPTARIYDLMRLVEEPILLINSDIEMHGSQAMLLDALRSRESIVGLRHNYDTGIFDAIVEPWGVDAFLLFPEAIATFPDLDFAIGQTMWDYWIPKHLESIGAKMRWAGEPFFFHKSHPVHWKHESLETGRKMLADLYGIEDSMAAWQKWRMERPYGLGYKGTNSKPS
jgi:hypothetical protein